MAYAWTDIVYVDKKKERQVLKAGSDASPEILNVSEEEFYDLVDCRAVRNAKYPNMPAGYTGSPRDFILAQRKRELQEIDDLDVYAEEEVVEEEQTEEIE